MDQKYREGLTTQIAQVFEAHPRLFDHRDQHPWLTGALGDPHAGIWFVAENPSLTQVERAQDPAGGDPTEEAQWWASRGDKLFRENLVQHGFKAPPASSHGGWHCYITNVIKEADYAERWKGSPATRRREAALLWRGVLQWELEFSRPNMVVALGKTVEGLLDLLASHGVRFPDRTTIPHYAYVAHRPRGNQGPMHPDRVAEYADDFRRVRQVFDGRVGGVGRDDLAGVLDAALFAAQKHSTQRRKDSDTSPYINHPLAVAHMLAEHGVQDPVALRAALLHDTIEDTATTEVELVKRFGAAVAAVVMEVSDDKSLEKAERKRLQVAHAPSLSHPAKLIKIADLTCNVRDVHSDPPASWSVERRRAYVEWARSVVHGCRGAHQSLEQAFEGVARLAEASL